MHQLIELDTWLLLQLNGNGNMWLDHFWTTVTDLHTWLPMGFIAVITLWYACEGGWKRKATLLLVVALLIVALDQTASALIKPIAARLRPSHTPGVEDLLHYVNGYRGGRYSFPSGHATTCAGIATWLWLTFRNPLARTCFVLFALVMGYSRIYLGVHYPSDVLAGFALGTAMAVACHKLVSHHFTIPSNHRPTLLLLAFLFTLTTILFADFQRPFTLLCSF